MRNRLVLAAVLSMLSLPTAAFANGDAPQVAECAPPQDCGERVITKYRTIGYKDVWVRKPIRKPYKVKVKVKCEEDCEPKVVKTEAVNIPAPPPKIVYQEQKVIVITRPKVEYAPPMQVHVAPARPVFYHRPQVVHVAPPPPPVVRMVCCPPGRYIPNLPPCPPGFSGNGHPQQQMSYNGHGRSSNPPPMHNPAVAPGTVGGGYVSGAPTSPQDCVARGGTDTGSGCKNYR